MTQKLKKKKKKIAVTTQNCFKKTLMVELYVHCNLNDITHQQIFSQLDFFWFSSKIVFDKAFFGIMESHFLSTSHAPILSFSVLGIKNLTISLRGPIYTFNQFNHLFSDDIVAMVVKALYLTDIIFGWPP